MTFDSTKFEDGPDSHERGRFLRFGLTSCCLLFALSLAATACSGDESTSDDDDSQSTEGANAEADDDDDESGDDTGKEDAGSSGKGDSGAMRADAGRIDAGMATETKPDASGPDTGAKHDSSTSQGAGGGACTRDDLKAVTAQYFEALSANDPSSLPLASSVKYTENGATTEVGEGVWATAGELKFKRSIFDTETCNSVSESVVANSGDDFIIGLRLKLVSEEIAEIEAILVGPDGWFPNPSALIASERDDWETELREGERATREELKKVVDDYFGLFSGGSVDDYPFGSDCTRLENGFSPGACTFGIPTGLRMTPRLYVLDEEAGVGLGFVMFAGSFTDFHMFKVRGGEVQSVHAVLASARSSGWE